MKRVKLEWNLAGVPRDITIDEIELDKIDLDPLNPRIGFFVDSQISDEISQQEISFALREKEENFRRLKLSIETHGLHEPIWVAQTQKGRYVVIDGNTRLEVYRDLHRKYPLKKQFQEIRCKILPRDVDEKTKMFVRLIAHLRGVNVWEVYERARLLYILWDLKGYTEEDLQSQTKLPLTEIKKYIQAYKEMTEQFLPKYGHLPDPLSKFSYFKELQNSKIKNALLDAGITVADFCRWVGEGEIKKAQHVRHLGRILKDKIAKEALVRNGYKHAFEQLSLSCPAVKSKLFEHIESVIFGLREMTREEEQDLIEGKEECAKREILIELFNELSPLIKQMHSK